MLSLFLWSWRAVALILWFVLCESPGKERRRFSRVRSESKSETPKYERDAGLAGCYDYISQYPLTLLNWALCWRRQGGGYPRATRSPTSLQPCT